MKLNTKKTSLKYCSFIIILLFMGCSNLTNMDRLTEKNGLIYKDDELFSGKTYSSLNSKSIFGFSNITLGDSIMYHIKDGFCEQIVGYYRNQVYMKVNQVKVGNDLQTITEKYVKDIGIIGSNQIIEKLQFINGDLSGEQMEWGIKRSRMKTKSLYLKNVSNYKRNTKHGTEISYYENDQKMEVKEYIEGKISGENKGWFFSGDIQFERIYDQGSIVEEKKYYNKNGILKNLRKYKNDTLIEAYTYSLNKKIIYKLTNNKEDSIVLDGLYELQQEDKEIHVNYDTGKKSGSETIYYPSGKVWEKLQYSNGVLHGVHEKWYKNGQLAFHTEYDQGKKTGVENKWYTNNQLASETTYKNDKKEGISKEFYENGDRWKELNYTQKDEGEYCLYRSWYNNGEKAEIYGTLNGNKNGLYKKWWENGKLRLSIAYLDGAKHGIYKNWLKNGKLYRKWKFINGKKQ